MQGRQNISSGTKWEKSVGYSRAVKAGNIIEVSGTVAIDNGSVVGKDNAYEQTRFIIKKIETALKQAGSGLTDVVRTRIFTTDISKWEEIGMAHGEFFGTILPAATMVEVKALINPELLVEMEATAIIHS